MTRKQLFLMLFVSCAPVFSGCAVVAVADVVATAVVKTVGLAADAAIGTVRIAGKVVGGTVDAATPGSTP